MTDHNRSPEEADDEQFYQYHMDRNGSPLDVQKHKFKIGEKVIYEGLIATVESCGEYFNGKPSYGLVAVENTELFCTADETKCEPYNEGDEIDQSEALRSAQLHSAHIQNMVGGITDKFFREGTWIAGKIDVSAENTHDGGDIICEAPEFWDESMEHWKANASLIAEAGNVYNETGFTPKQLAEQNKELIEALERLVEGSLANDFNEHWDCHTKALKLLNSLKK